MIEKFELVDVDSTKAYEWLEHNTRNRTISWAVVDKYATDMVNGRWKVSTDMIGFDTDGRLIQGQHRLYAVLRADEIKPGIVIPMMVGWGYPPEVYDVLDQGRVRGAGAVLQSHGMTQATVAAAASRQLLYYDRMPGNVWTNTAAISRVEVIQNAVEHRDLFDAVGRNRLPASINRVSWNVLQILVMRDSEHADRWEEFVEAVSLGANLPPGHPALALRNRTVLNDPTWGLNGAQPRLGLYIKAWNAFIKGRSIRRLMFKRTELPMPKVI